MLSARQPPTATGDVQARQVRGQTAGHRQGALCPVRLHACEVQQKPPAHVVVPAQVTLQTGELQLTVFAHAWLPVHRIVAFPVSTLTVPAQVIPAVHSTLQTSPRHETLPEQAPAVWQVMCTIAAVTSTSRHAPWPVQAIVHEAPPPEIFP